VSHYRNKRLRGINTFRTSPRLLLKRGHIQRIAASNDPFCFIAANIRIQFSGNSIPLLFFIL